MLTYIYILISVSMPLFLKKKEKKETKHITKTNQCNIFYM